MAVKIIVNDISYLSRLEGNPVSTTDEACACIYESLWCYFGSWAAYFAITKLLKFYITKNKTKITTKHRLSESEKRGNEKSNFMQNCFKKTVYKFQHAECFPYRMDKFTINLNIFIYQWKYYVWAEKLGIMLSWDLEWEKCGSFRRMLKIPRPEYVSNNKILTKMDTKSTLFLNIR